MINNTAFRGCKASFTNNDLDEMSRELKASGKDRIIAILYENMGEQAFTREMPGEAKIKEE